MNWLERGWYQQHKGSYFLLPLSGVFYLLSGLRRLLFKLGLKKQHKLEVPVIVVGNITVGGTGKTPFVIWLVQWLKQQGWQPGVISRGYGSQIKQGCHVVTAADDAFWVGDEVKLIFDSCQVPVVVAPNRVEAGRQLLQNQQCNIIVCDDGLQHYRLARDIEIILIDGQRQFGNGCLLPAGPLREGLWRLKTSNFVIQNGVLTEQSHCRHFFTTELLTPKKVALTETDCEIDLTQAFRAVCAIANPQRFYHSLAQLNLTIIDKHEFSDHHHFTAQDFANWSENIMMTAKDAVKCREFARENWWYLPIQIQPDALFIEKLSKKLDQIRENYGF